MPRHLCHIWNALLASSIIQWADYYYLSHSYICRTIFSRPTFCVWQDLCDFNPYRNMNILLYYTLIFWTLKGSALEYSLVQFRVFRWKHILNAITVRFLVESPTPFTFWSIDGWRWYEKRIKFVFFSSCTSSTYI